MNCRLVFFAARKTSFCERAGTAQKIYYGKLGNAMSIAN